MRFIFLATMFASMLFSAQQRQIVIGSFSIENNAINYAKAVEKELRSDENLKNLMEKYALKVEEKKVGKFNVVSLCAFENYPSLFQTMAVLKKHYPEAYAINFPAYPSMKHEKVVAAEADLEILKAEELEDEVDAVQEAVDEPFIAPEVEPVAKKPMPMPAPIPQIQDEDNTQELLLLLLLLVVIIIYILYKIKTKKRDPLEE